MAIEAFKKEFEEESSNRKGSQPIPDTVRRQIAAIKQLGDTELLQAITQTTEKIAELLEEKKGIDLTNPMATSAIQQLNQRVGFETRIHRAAQKQLNKRTRSI